MIVNEFHSLIFSFLRRTFSIDSGVVTTQEVFENDLSSMTAEKLFHELQRVKEDLKLKDKEIHRANELRENTDREIEELTASLFEVMKIVCFLFFLNLNI